MNVIGKPGVDRCDFRSSGARRSRPSMAAASRIDSHVKILREAGMTAEQVQAAVRIAAVVHAVAATLEASHNQPIRPPLPWRHNITLV